ncbi:MAG: hypothetical protein A2144_04675 [Chloroflexi bacterium RBG_16_50_9]|nr:MAG: hypothetical protein A2144_04675 [Chloroflexi bacterium RBG_16_50_9]
MRLKYRGTGGCLPCSADFVSKPESPSFEGGETAWKAGTLPLSYSRSNRIYFNLKSDYCQSEANILYSKVHTLVGEDDKPIVGRVG